MSIQRLTFGHTRPYRPPKQDSTQSDECREVYHKAYEDFEFFIRHFLSGHFWGELSPMHRDVVNLEAKPVRRGALEVIAAPRGNAKTVFWVLAKTIHSIVYGYQPFTVIIGYSAQEAEGKVKDIRDELLNNEELIRVYGKMLTGKPGTQSFTAKNGCMVLARGRGGQVRGLRHGKHRPTKIICDDVEDLEAVQSPLQREKTKLWFTKDVMPAIQSGEEFKGAITFIGTVLHENALLPDLLTDPSWTRNKYKAVISWAEREDLWQQWRNLYNNLDDPASKDTAKAFYLENEPEMLKGTEVLWPDGESYYELMVQQLKMGTAAFASEKQNDPFDPERQILHPEKCQRFKVIWPGDPQWPQGYEDGFAVVLGDRFAHSNQLKIIAFHDPAMAEEKKSDYAAIVVCAQDASGYIYVLDVWLKKEPPDKQIKAALKLYQKWQVSTLYFEAVMFAKLFKPLYRQEVEKQKLQNVKLIGTDQHKNKEFRINTLEPYFENSVLRLNEKLDGNFIDQLRLFPTADHDDGPDALQGCVERLKKPANIIQVTSEGELIR